MVQLQPTGRGSVRNVPVPKIVNFRVSPAIQWCLQDKIQLDHSTANIFTFNYAWIHLYPTWWTSFGGVDRRGLTEALKVR